MAPAGAGGAPAASRAVIPKCARWRTQRLRKELLQLAAALSPPAHAAPARALRSSALRLGGDTRSGGGGKSGNLGKRCRDCGLRQNSAPRGVMPLHGRQHSITRTPAPADDSKWAAARLEELRSQPASLRKLARKTARCISRKCASQAQQPSRRCRKRTTANARASQLSPWSSTESVTGAWKCAARPKGGCRTSCRQASATAQALTAAPSSWPAPAPRR